MARNKIGNVYPSDEYLLARCAPVGYGIGAAVCAIPPDYDANKISGEGFFQCYKNTPNDNENWYIIPFSHVKGIYEHQTAIRVIDGSKAERTMVNGVWGEWERDNPPLTPSVEYRTTERWQDKPVYYKVVEFGGLPNATTVSVPIGVENIEWVFLDISKSWIGPVSDLTTNYSVNWSHITEMIISQGQITITTNANMTGTLAYLTVKYTKTTD